jgi:hypothetical protein
MVDSDQPSGARQEGRPVGSRFRRSRTGKIVRSHEDMADERTGWVSDLSPNTVKLIGVLGLLAVSST